MYYIERDHPVISAAMDTAARQTVASEKKTYNLLDGNLDSYDSFFRFGRIFKRPVLRKFLENRNKLILPTAVIDGFSGQGVAVRDMMEQGLIRAGLLINLTDLRTPGQKAYDKTHNIQQITGNIYTRDIWNAIDRWLSRQTPNGKADLILSRPVGGTGHVFPIEGNFKPIPSWIFEILFNRAVSRLESGGKLLAQVPFQFYADRFFLMGDTRTAADERMKTLVRNIKDLNLRNPDMNIAFEKDLGDWYQDADFMPGLKYHCGTIMVDNGELISKPRLSSPT